MWEVEERVAVVVPFIEIHLDRVHPLGREADPLRRPEGVEAPGPVDEQFLRVAVLEEVVAIACADKLDNMRMAREQLAIQGQAFWEHFNRPSGHQAWYYRTLEAGFRARLSATPWRSLAEQYTEVVSANFPDPGC
jgi:hypothetical protein